VELIRDAATGVHSHGSTLQVSLRHGDKPVQADKVVLAAGAWSGALAKSLGDRIPVEAERGYNTTISQPQVTIARELIFGEHGFVATQLDCGLRIGGGAEFAGLDEPPYYARADAMLTKAARFLPGLNTHQGVKWMGCRPSMPDYRPVIGPSPGHPQVLYAFGHGHLGLTQAAGTAKLIAQLALGRKPDINIDPYSPSRFA
jgi:D-amino-acid dehydrogenase